MHACFIAVNFSIHTGWGGGGGRKVSTFMSGEAQKVCLQSGGGGVKKVFNSYFPHLPTPLPINNDCFKTSGALCWFEMGCYDTDLSMLRIPQLDLPQKPYKNPRIRRSARLEIRTRSSRVGQSTQRQQNFENRTDINSTKILKQLLSLLNNILAL